jgi:hypothetical protein
MLMISQQIITLVQEKVFHAGKYRRNKKEI